jgi:hypothetical protein
MKKSMGPTEDKIAFEKPAQKRTKKQVRQENRAERKATRKSEGSVARQALRRGINKVKSAVSNATQKRVKKKDVVTQTSRKIQAPKATTKINVKKTSTSRIKGVTPDKFGDAFKQARKNQGAGGRFKYRGKTYSTDTKEDVAKRKKAASAKLKPSKQVKSYKMGEDPSLD